MALEGPPLPQGNLEITTPKSLDTRIAQNLVIDKLMNANTSPGFISLRFIKDDHGLRKPVPMRIFDIHQDPEASLDVQDEERIAPGTYALALDSEISVEALETRLANKGMKMNLRAEGEGYVAWEIKYSTYVPSIRGGGMHSIAYDKSMTPQAFFQINAQGKTITALCDLFQLED